METNITNTKAVLQWSAISQAEHERDRQWYIRAAIVTLLFAAYGILTGNWTFTIVIVLGAGVYFMLRNTPPALKNIQILESGFTLDGFFTQWSDCKDFWLINTPLYTELHIMKKNGFIKETVIQTGPIDPALVRTTLASYITERSDQKERILDMLTRFLKL